MVDEDPPPPPSSNSSWMSFSDNDTYIHVLKVSLFLYLDFQIKMMSVQIMLQHGGTVLQSSLLVMYSMASQLMCGRLVVYLQSLLQGSLYGQEDQTWISYTWSERH